MLLSKIMALTIINIDMARLKLSECIKVKVLLLISPELSVSRGTENNVDRKELNATYLHVAEL
jgi:hypothetical protein